MVKSGIVLCPQFLNFWIYFIFFFFLSHWDLSCSKNSRCVPAHGSVTDRHHSSSAEANRCSFKGSAERISIQGSQSRSWWCWRGGVGTVWKVLCARWDSWSWCWDWWSFFLVIMRAPWRSHVNVTALLLVLKGEILGSKTESEYNFGSSWGTVSVTHSLEWII